MKHLLIVITAFSCLPVRAFAQGEPVRVECVDDSTKTLFNVSNMFPDQLPDKFQVNNILDIKGVKWVVLSANPAAKSDFTKAGKITLLLARADKMYPGGAPAKVFAVPTISGGLGAVTGRATPGPGILSIHANDWRQIEFISTSHEQDIEAEFDDIHKIWTTAHTGSGFSDLHIRERITAPVQGCTLREVEDLIPPLHNFDAVGFQGQAGTVPHSFAWTVDPSMAVWGLTDDDGNITQLCIAGWPQKDDVPAISAALSKLTLRYDLYLVDWCREISVHGEVIDFEKYFYGQ